jgi:LDH2 family malate/lactate/ureidoglycolate dehydrogenase
VGNNPFAVAIPAGKHYPVVLDMAQTVVAKGKIIMATKTGNPIPPEWAFDKYGSVTTDAKMAAEGTLRPIADYKGYGIAVVIGLLSSVISNADIGASLINVYTNFSRGMNKGHLFAAVDLKCMTDVAEFKKRMDREIDYIKGSSKAPETEEIYLPGELEWLSWDRQVREGIIYPIEVINEIKDISTSLGVAIPVV